MNTCPHCHKDTRFTREQLADWRRYERVRASGKFNMFFPQARAATRLPEKRYAFVIRNYEALERISKQIE